MKNNKATYFNFPIKLLDGFMSGSTTVLNNILDYAVYDHFLKLEYDNKKERLIDCEQYFGIELGDRNKSYMIGKELHENNECLVKVGINLTMFWDFYKNDKTSFEKICLLGFLAIKSILQQKPYCKVTMKYWLARMDGKSKSCEFSEISEQIKEYTIPYRARKIKAELENSWGLITYSRYTRGFYVSYKLKLEELVFQAEKRRKSTLSKQKKIREKEAIRTALWRLENTQP